MCLDQKEAQDILAGMVAELVKAAGDLGTLTVMTNDAGAGLCWSEWLYTGPNGPAGCERVSTVDRVAKLLSAIRRGAGADRPLDVRLTGNFTKNEQAGINQLRDGGLSTRGRSTRVRRLHAGTMGENPVLGMIDPVGIIQSMERGGRSGKTKIFISFGMNYSRVQPARGDGEGDRADRAVLSGDAARAD